MRMSQLFILLISVFSIVFTSGCTSSQTEGDQATAEVTDESLEMAEAIDNNDDLSMDFDGGEDAFADLGEGTEFSESSDLALSEETTTPLFEETPPVGSDDLSETPLAETPPAEEAPLDELAPDFGAPTEDTAVAENTTSEEPAPDFGAPIESAEPDFGEPTPEPTFSEPDTYASTDIPSDESTEPLADNSSMEPEIETSSPSYIPLKKVISVPYMHAGKPVNGIYMAREGDTLQSISQKIFGGDRVSELCDINAYNCSRSLKVGDKYYYNSPQRPNDVETVKTFYEDAGIPAQTYITQEGDNIRTLGSTLLGHPRSWMELWALNPDIESKDVLPAGVALKYWPSTSVSLPTLAQSEPEVVESAPAETEVAAQPEIATEPEAPPAESEVPAPPMEDMALNDIPEVPQGTVDMNEVVDDFAQQNDAGNDPAMGSVGEMEPPPPPPPPPPPMESAPPMDMAGNDTQYEDPNQTMALGVGAILLLAGVALFIAIRKRRARRPVDFNTTTQTQIE